MSDFLIFCKLAVSRKVVPQGGSWSWGGFLETAVTLLPYAFEKSDAQVLVLKLAANLHRHGRSRLRSLPYSLFFHLLKRTSTAVKMCFPP